MAVVANDPAAAKRLGIPRSVGKDFMKADKGRSFEKGGEMKESKAMIGKEMAFMKKKGAPKSMIKHEAAEMGAMKKGAAKKGMPKFAAGGSVFRSAADGVASRGKTKGKMMRKGGKVC
jgi:hypothetical protein